MWARVHIARVPSNFCCKHLNGAERGEIQVKPTYIDTHAHCNLPAYANDLDEVREAVRAVGVERIISPAISYESNKQMLEKLLGYPEISFALGIHPKHVCSGKLAKREMPALASMKALRTWHTNRLRVLDELSEQVEVLRDMAKNEPRVVAIGETGLDYSLHPSEFERAVQAALFRLLVNLSLNLQLPLVLHVRNAHADAVTLLRGYHGTPKGVVHCFDGGPKEAREYLDLGLYLGIGGRVTHKENKALREAVAIAPSNRLVLETDAPYVRPSAFERERNDSTAIPMIAREVAVLRGEDIEEVAAHTTENAERLFVIGDCFGTK